MLSLEFHLTLNGGKNLMLSPTKSTANSKIKKGEIFDMF